MEMSTELKDKLDLLIKFGSNELPLIKKDALRSYPALIKIINEIIDEYKKINTKEIIIVRCNCCDFNKEVTMPCIVEKRYKHLLNCDTGDKLRPGQLAWKEIARLKEEM